MTYTEAITLCIAALGAVLGIINTWHSISQSKLKMKVTPKYAIPFGATDSNIDFCIEVINRSNFPVTVIEVGVFHRGTKTRSAYTQPILLDGGHWPRRLEARESVTVYGQRPESRKKYRIRCAYAKTDCGETVTGSSAALRQIAHKLG